MEKFEFKGTPHGGGNWAINVNSPKQVLIDNVCIIDQGMDIPGVLEDAHLISAAPLLLSALIKAVEFEDHKKRVYNIADSIYAEPNWYYEAKAAIQAAISQPENIKG